MNLIFELLTNPAIVSLIAGVAIGIVTTVKVPRWFSDIVSIYLIFVIGLKGGACLGTFDACTPALLSLAVIGAVIGFFQPFVYYWLLRILSRIDDSTRVIVASQYGSISIVTFVTGMSFLTKHGIAYDSFMSFVAGIMEVPAIFSGLLLVEYRKSEKHKSLFAILFEIAKNIILCKKISMIFVGFFVGYLMHIFDFDSVANVLKWPFDALLILFMIDIGIKIAGQRSHFSSFTPGLLAFGVGVPLVSGVVGVLIAPYFSPLPGTALLFALLLASASYIAVPAVMSARVRDAKEAVYLPLALGVTLPFNIMIGIPLFYSLINLITPYF